MVQFRNYFFAFFFLLAAIPQAFTQHTYVPPKIPDKAQKKLAELVLASKGGQEDAAIAGLNDLIEHYPTWTEPRHELSRIYYEKGNRKESVAILEKSIAIDTTSQLKQLFTLGRLYEETEEPDKAKICYTTYIAKAEDGDPLKQKAQENLDQFVVTAKDDEAQI
jgi:tetratricopeptide (TPR) repeat protein